MDLEFTVSLKNTVLQLNENARPVGSSHPNFMERWLQYGYGAIRTQEVLSSSE
jgi:hypothetical protein